MWLAAISYAGCVILRLLLFLSDDHERTKETIGKGWPGYSSCRYFIH